MGKITYQQMDILAPSKLLKQIVLLQSVYYVIGFVMILFTYVTSGQPFTLSAVFSWEPVTFDTSMGWTLAMLWLFDTFFSVLAMTVIVGRSKLALDFTLTLHGLHFIVTWLVAGKFPASLLWYIVQVISVILMVSLGTWTSQWRELRVSFFEEAYEMIPRAGAGESSGASTTETTVPSASSSSGGGNSSESQLKNQGQSQGQEIRSESSKNST